MNIQASSQKNAAPRIAVIGAGPAGLFAAHLARREGAQVALFESHSKPGGCASYFRRKIGEGENFALFDAGATVLPDFAPDSFMKKLIDSFGVTIAPAQRNEALRFDVRGRRFKLDATSTNAWTTSLIEAFPKDAAWMRARLPKMAHQAHKLWESMQGIPHLPLQTATDVRLNLPLLARFAPLSMQFACGEFKSFGDQLRSWGASEEFREWSDMSLLITLQCNADEAHPLWAAGGLFFYPLGTSHLPGGMKGLFEPMLEKLKADPQAKVFMRTPVLKVIEDPTTGKWKVQTTEGEFGLFDAIFSSVPRFGAPDLFSPRVHAPDDDLSSLIEELWTADVVYLVVEDHPEWAATGFCMHSRHAAPGDSPLNGGELWATFSARENSVRAPAGLRTVTLSTHARPGDWPTDVRNYRGDSSYLSQKGQAAQKLIENFRKSFPEARIVFEEAGSPSTFLRYTRRPHGSVGGLPLNRSFTGFLKCPSVRTRHPRVFQIGDTAFPGQSVQSCAVGAAAAIEKWLGRKIS